jgi:acetolactate synthase-1/2/3 large subunit
VVQEGKESKGKGGKVSTISGGRVVVEVLKAEGVKFVFGLPGGHTLAIYDGLYNNPEIRHILVRHEQTAANMAAAYPMLTGEPGVCCATAGPGATNLATGIAEAFFGAVPVIFLTGRAPAQISLRGAAQEIPQEKVFAPITKWAVRVERADMIAEIMRQAFTIARSGKPGPVLIDFPVDTLMQPVEFAGYVPVGKPPAPRGNPGLVRMAVDEILNSKQPIIIAGGGAVMSGAFNELREFAETLGLPVLTTLSGRGSFSDDHPLAGGGLGMHRSKLSKKLLAEADFVLGLGCRLEQFETNWRPGYVPAANACYVQVDTDPAEMGKSVIPKIGIVSDIKLLLEDMLEVVREKGGPDHRSGFGELLRIKDLVRRKEVEETEIKRSTGTNEKPMSAAQVVREIREVFPRETTAAVDIGCLAQGLGGSSLYFKIYEPRSIIPCTSFYAMGFAASAIPVARLVYPERPAVAMCGDGSFQMIMNVLPVAVEHHLPVTWCILNNQSLGSIRDVQEQMYGNRCIATSFAVQPDFALIAQACKCYGEKVEDPHQIKAALGRAIDANNQGVPAVLDFVVSRKESEAAIEYFGSL